MHIGHSRDTQVPRLKLRHLRITTINGHSTHVHITRIISTRTKVLRAHAPSNQAPGTQPPHISPRVTAANHARRVVVEVAPVTLAFRADRGGFERHRPAHLPIFQKARGRLPILVLHPNTTSTHSPAKGIRILSLRDRNLTSTQPSMNLPSGSRHILQIILCSTNLSNRVLRLKGQRGCRIIIVISSTQDNSKLRKVHNSVSLFRDVTRRATRSRTRSITSQP